MNIFEKFLALLDGKMTTPTAFGWFHILAIVLVIVGIVVVCLTCKQLTDKQFRIITLCASLLLIIFEIYKQLNFSYNPSTDTWDYQWYAFPFQFCSTPMYVMLLIACLKEGKFRDFLCSFLATFGLFAGLIVMILPGDVFIDTIGINIQTMVHHGTMVVMGVFMFVSGRAKIQHKTILKGAAVFAVLVAMAFVLNIIFHYAGNGETFNMFYIGPYIPCHLILLSDLWAVLPYPIWLIIYIAGFTLAGYVMLLIAMLIKKIATTINNKKSLAKKQ